MNLDKAINIEDLRRMARRRVPRFVFDFVDGGAEDEVTLRANRRSFERLRFRPRTLAGVSGRSTGGTILGAPSALPAVAAPVGLLGLVRRHGDLELARAAAASGIPFTLSTSSMDSLEEVARAAPGRLWFQCYVFPERSVSEGLIRRAAEAGFEALVITSDFPVSGKRERDLRSGLRPNARLTLGTKLDILMHPRWFLTVATHRPRFAVVERGLGAGRNAASFLPATMFDPTLCWDDLRRFRDLWKGKLLLKGVLRADDAARAVECGVDGVILSNHGGRQLDGAVSGMDALPDVAREIGGRASILVDGGVRRGGDIAKALALGAEGVLLGRALAYGVAAGGTPGAARALEILRDEFDRTLALLGCRTPADLAPDLIATRAAV
ncbi:MAG TPA: alpha-hydroxy acid oxidase [Candidatus Eisenbacteria bacterium]|nr:alpha-hydroxy acid oxidase [Candidatus Eisenbacteria bacterium]